MHGARRCHAAKSWPFRRDTWAPPGVVRRSCARRALCAEEQSCRGSDGVGRGRPRGGGQELDHTTFQGVSCGKLSRMVNGISHCSHCVTSATVNFRTPEACAPRGSRARSRVAHGPRTQDVLRLEYTPSPGQEAGLTKFSTKPVSRELVILDTQSKLLAVQTASPQACVLTRPPSCRTACYVRSFN